MKKTLLLLMALIKIATSEAQFSLPQLQAGVYVDTTFAYFVYSFPGYCDSLGAYDVILSVDASSTPLVTGVEIHGIVISVSPTDSVSTIQTGILHIGDTLKFSSPTSNYYTISSTAVGGIALELIIVGTPSVPFENYPCETHIICTLADCANTCLVLGYTPFQCSVDDFSGINESSQEQNWLVTPNPVIDKLNVAVNNIELSEIIIYDIASRKILQQKFSNSTTINTEHLVKGIYLYEVRNKGGLCKKGKVVKD